MDHFMAALFRLDDATWARHANPWSVWTRVPLLAVLVLAGWSRAWIGWWAVLPAGAALVWAWVNPRCFVPPASIDSWASKAVLGERIWLDRERVAVPARHRLLPRLLSLLAAAGTGLAAWGTFALQPWPTLLGLVTAYGGKLWFVDRMVWLFEDMAGNDARYRAGLPAGPTRDAREP